MPGAGRLLFHLHHAGVRVGLATSTPRATMERKLSAPAAQGLRGIFQARLRPYTLALGLGFRVSLSTLVSELSLGSPRSS